MDSKHDSFFSKMPLKRTASNTNKITYLTKIDVDELEEVENITVFVVIGKWKSKDVAIKIKNANDDCNFFENEMKIVDYLAGKKSEGSLSPFITILGYNDSLLVMEFMSNGCLVDFLFHYPQEYTQPLIPYIALDFFMGLQALHSYNVIHRDIKCENILIDAENHAKLCDFGFSVIADDNHEYHNRQLLGTVKYLAPELIINHRGGDLINYTFASDMYAAAMVVYVLFNRESPYHDMPSPEIFNKVLENHKGCSLDKVPSPFSLFMERNWNTSPTKRMTASEGVELVQSSLTM